MKPNIRATDHLKSFDYHQNISMGMRRIKKTKIEATELPPILDLDKNKESKLSSYAPLTERGGQDLQVEDQLLPSVVKKEQPAALTLPKRYASTKPQRAGASTVTSIKNDPYMMKN